MIPRKPLELDPQVPSGHTYCTPKRDDLSEEGFGYFRDTWLIRGVGIREARAIITIESDLVEIAARLAVDDVEFDQVAEAFETSDPEALPRRLFGSAAVAEIEPHLSVDDSPPLDGLELGVAGLVYALGAVGCWPAASCRGHPTAYAWADHPVVFLAADRHRVAVLQPLVAEARCGFATDPARPELLVVQAESMEETTNLARFVFSKRREFVPRRGPRSRGRGSSVIQTTLDFGS
ncbi:MAG: hypothetical protein GEV03_22270 [Streptosporangiales bacterium]|nr:hypothetical protein [Streptosporangiales bacterium]